MARMTKKQAEELIVLHTEARREKILAAFEAVKRLDALDRKMVARWATAGAIDELQLGQEIADYRRRLGVAYGSTR